MAPPTYKLTYFESRGIAEPVRLMFAYKEIQYEDVRISKDDWPTFKLGTPFGKLPVLEVDGVVLAESSAISRYVAKELGLYGRSSFEGATIDMYLDALMDCLSHLRKVMLEEDQEKKAGAAKKFFTEVLPPFLSRLEHYLTENGGKFYIGDELTLADISIAHFMNEIRGHNVEIFEKCPSVSNHVAFIHNLPEIKAWVDKRPQKSEPVNPIKVPHNRQ